MLEFAKSAAPVMVVDVPGHGNVTHKRSPDEARKCTAALVHWLADLHYHGYCLKGKMQASDFGISLTGCVRGEKHLLEKVREMKGKKKRMKKDMNAGADIIEQEIYDSIQPNPDVAHLVFLLRKFEQSYYPLLRSHICHFREVKLSAIYTKMYDHLMTLKIADKSKYDAILMQLPYASDWISKIMAIAALHKMQLAVPIGQQRLDPKLADVVAEAIH
ncbi:uncharacterized protein C2845_PM11G21960 [Panicum miliaceum]|uniref:Uncharacterized protein n=1 Tax=Panicum miliaceum TaxID=4540 RepID=A0A3L6RQW5_PANMI|nr:uncharacterized protein C2845_PM11G21960 [Panicum miliaceum]